MLIVIYGDPGVGKTYYACKHKKIIAISTDNSYQRYTDGYTIDNWDSIPVGIKNEVVLIDNIDNLLDIAGYHYLNNGYTDVHYMCESPYRQAKAAAREMIYLLIAKTNAMNKLVYVTAQSDIVNDRIYPSFDKELRKALISLSDILIYIERPEGGDAWGWFGHHPVYTTKDREGILYNKYGVDTMDNIMDKLNEAEGVVQNESLVHILK